VLKEVIFGIEIMTKLFDLNGKTAIIAGASSGLRKCFARLMH
jgi:hypothetical protein